MKTITFFSEKGGVGKSTFSIMYASWLKYKMGAKVALADFNARIYNYRQAEIRERGKLIREGRLPETEQFDTENAWPIVNCRYDDIRELKKNGIRMPYAMWLDRQLKTNELLFDCDVVICDYPGNITSGEFLQCLASGLLSTTVTPVEKDEMTIQSTIKLKNTMESMYGNDLCAFINKARLELRNMKGSYPKLAEALMSRGLRVLPDMISFSERITSIDKVNNIRSTFSFPEFDEKAGDLGITNLFIDVTRELAKHPDLKGTAPADLSFIESLVKTDDGRQLKRTQFPDYEL